MNAHAAAVNRLTRGLKFWFGPLVTSRVWLQSGNLMLDLPVGIATFTFVVTFLSLGGGLVITLIGIPLLAATVIAGRLIASLERQRAKIFLQDDFATPPNFDLSNPSLKTMWAALKDVPGWKGLLHGLLALPLGIINFTILVTLWALAISCTFSTIGLLFQTGNGGNLFSWSGSHQGEHLSLWGPPSGLGDFLMYFLTTVFGVFLLGLAPRIIDGLSKLKSSVVRALCAQNEKEMLNKRVSSLEESRTASVLGAASELRRIERDLHDGAQQHLVSVAMQLGIAKERLANGGDPRVAEIVDSAHKDAKAAIAELRNLVRGIHPSVLTDRGLDAAISALAGRSPISIEVQYEIVERLPSTSEVTAYFVVAEALTNIAKHSGATHAAVRVWQSGDRVNVEVTDDGRGGAHEGDEGGLRGLHDRVRAIEGTLNISSPVGGPTKILVELPCV